MAHRRGNVVAPTDPRVVSVRPGRLISVLSGFDSRRADDTWVWLNLAERSVRGREVAGSIPATQTVEEESVGDGARLEGDARRPYAA